MPLGQDPQTGKDVFLRDGPYGPYVQLGASPADAADSKPVRAPIKLKGCARSLACLHAFFPLCDWHLMSKPIHLAMLPRTNGL